MSTMEDWTDVMYINMYGCNELGWLSFIWAVGGVIHAARSRWLTGKTGKGLLPKCIRWLT